MQYGLPQRSAVQDANEGKINPPALKRDTSVATTSATKQLSDVHLEELNIGQELGSVLGGFISQHAEDIYAKQKLQVATRKGLDEGIHLVDKTNKRTGFMEAVFGQHAGYREAQQRAVETRVNKDYLRVQSELDKYAGSDPVEFHKQVIEPKLTELATLYKDDPETRELAETAFIDSAQKLVKQQQADYIAYGVEQNKQTTIDSLNVKIDQWKVDKSKLVDPVAQADMDQMMVQDFQKSTKGATDIATKQMQFEVIDQQIKAGNIDMYNLLKNDGWTDSLTPTQKAKVDQAIVHYDAKLVQEAALLNTQTDAQLYEAESETDVDAILSVYEQNAQKLEERSSGSVTSQQGLLNNEFGITKAGDLRKAQIEKLRKKGLEAVAEKQKEQQETDLGVKAVLDPQAMVQYVQDTGKEMTNSDRNKFTTAAVMQNLKANLGENAPKDEYELRARIAEPDVLNNVIATMNTTKHTPPFVERLVTDMIDNPNFFMDEHGNPIMDRVTSYMPVMDKLMANGRAGKLDSDQQMRLATIQDQLRSGMSLTQIQEYQRTAANNSEKKPAKMRDYYAVKGTTFDIEGTTNNKLKDIGFVNPSQADRLEYQERWEQAMAMTNYNRTAAETYVNKIYENQKERIGSTTIVDGNMYLKEAHVSVSDTLKAISADDLNPEAQKALAGIDPVTANGMTVEMNNFERTVTMRVAGHIKPVVLSFDDMQRWYGDSLRNDQRRQKLDAALARKNRSAFDVFIGSSTPTEPQAFNDA